MVTKNTKQRSGKGKVRVLNLRKETVKDLTKDQAKGVKGGITKSLPAVGGKSLPAASFVA